MVNTQASTSLCDDKAPVIQALATRRLPTSAAKALLSLPRVDSMVGTKVLFTW